MPQIVQTGMSSAINFLSGFGKGMVQADVNRRENEKLDIQKQKWQQEMTAYAAQDEFRRLQMENSRLEIDMRKTQFADLKATKEQTKGFTAYMFDAISNTKGDPANKQSALFEMYTQGAAQFPMADMSMGDKLIDTYAKIHTASAPKAWKIESVKDYETGKKRRAIMGEHGEFIGYMPGGDIKDKTGKVVGQAIGEENLEIVNETMANGIAMHQKEFDKALQAFMSGTRAVLGSEGQSLSVDDFMKSVKDLKGRDKSRVTMDWIFDVTTRLREDIEAETGTLDVRLGRMLTPFVHNNEARDALVSPYAKKNYRAEMTQELKDTNLEDRNAVIAQMASDFERLLPEYELPAVRMELARLQNKTAIEMKAQGEVDIAESAGEQRLMAEQVAERNAQKDEDLLKEYVGYEAKEKGWRESARDWWDDFLGEERKGVLFGEKNREDAAYETLRTMQAEGLIK